MVGAGGLVASIVAFAVGAILNFAVTVNPDQHGFNLNTVGMILMIVGLAGALLSVITMAVAIRAAAGLSLTMGKAMSCVESTHVLGNASRSTTRSALEETQL